MNEQTVLLILIIAALIVTFTLYFWKAKKQIEYKGDERWQTIQNKANHAANFSNHALILLVAIGDIILLTQNSPIMLSLDRVFTCVILFIGLRNAIEMFSLKYFDNRL